MRKEDKLIFESLIWLMENSAATNQEEFESSDIIINKLQEELDRDKQKSKPYAKPISKDNLTKREKKEMSFAEEAIPRFVIENETE